MAGVLKAQGQVELPEKRIDQELHLPIDRNHQTY